MKQSLRRHLQWGFFLLALAATLSVHAQDPKPNIVFFYIDDLGWTDLGTYGSDFYETPAIDQLAKDGVQFTSAYQAAARCVPSRKSLFTGKYHERPEVADGKGLSLSEYTFAEALRDEGYRTFFAGKWHLGKDSTRYPDQQGFDVNKAGCEWGAPQGSTEGGGHYFSPYGCPTLQDGPEGEYLTDRLTQETLDFIDAHQQTGTGDPFLACVFHYAVHTPIEASDSYVSHFRDKLNSMVYSRPEKEIDGPAKTNLRHDHPVYAGMIASVDESVRRIREKLELLGLENNTIIIFSTDHGGLSSTLKSNGREIATSNFPLRTGKGWLYEGGIRSPLIVHWPGQSPGGRVLDETVVSMDIYPTMLEMAGLPLQAQQHLDGESFAPLLRGEEWTRSDPIMWYFPFAKTGTGNPNMAALRSGDHKLIHFQHQDRFELYDISRDISESVDLAGTKPVLLSEMKQQLAEIQEQTSMPAVAQNRITLEEEEILPEYEVTVSPDALPEFSLDAVEVNDQLPVMTFTATVSEGNAYVHPVDLSFEYRSAGNDQWTGFLPDAGDFRGLIPGTYTCQWDCSEIKAEIVDVRVTAAIHNALDPESLGEVTRSDIRIKKKSPVELGFFEDYWTPKSAELPADSPVDVSKMLPETMVSVDLSDTISKVSPYVGGYNLNTYFGGRIYDKPELMRHAGNLALPFFRYPGGSGSLWYFWDLARPDLPDSVDFLTIKGETFHIGDKIRWGDIPGDDYLSLENSYTLRDQLGTEAIHVVNYALARYGRHQDPVAAAAHYAADWVRHDQGRTRFWEIGNEIYGSWEPSWIIDTARNLDGQPRQITGTLYAEHCLVFLDSMRAAAAETGAEIRIGATLGFQESREAWDREVLQVLGNRVDFYIVHKYFGNHQDASPSELFQSVEEFYQHKAHVNALIGQYCEKDVPLVLTEWNTRYSGRKQNVSCANGMHTLMAYKAIINEGIGLSGKWNLIWGYQNGDTHGLLSNEKDNPAVEGIPRYFPRAPFMYQYYFKKFLGDISVMNHIEKSGGLDAFSSHFTSGETGIVLQNTIAEERRVVVNLEDYQYGERFYWYTLTPYGGTDPFDRKVRVNGVGNDIYDAGGPLEYETIQANSASSGNGIRVILPPYSSAFILAEGDLLTPAGKTIVTFRVSSRKDGEVFPLEKAVVQAGAKLYITDANGEVQVPSPLDTLEYKLLAHGHDTISSSLVVEGPVMIRDTLEFTPYRVSFEFTDSESGLPIREGALTLGEQTRSLSAEGTAVFPEVSYGSYEMAISSKPYKEDIPLEVFSDTLFRLKLSKTLYNATILVCDRISGEAVSNAKITMGGDSFYPDLGGKAVYSDTFGVYDLRVEAESYHPFQAQLELQNDTVIEVSLLLAFADVKFKLYDGTTPVYNAQVDLNGDIRSTNSIGIANYYDLPTDTTYRYMITQPDFDTLAASFLLRQDTTLALNYSGKVLDVRIQVRDSWTGAPVPASQVVFDGVFKQSDAEGRVDYQVPPGSYLRTVTMDRFEENRDTVRISSDTSMQVLLTLQDAIVRFKVSGSRGVIEGAKVELGGSETRTNSLGVAVFNRISVGETYSFSVSNSGYHTLSSQVEVMHDTLVDITIYMTSLETNASNPPRVYPSPASARIHLESSFILEEVRMLDLKGVVHGIPWKIQGKKATAELGSFTSGVYILRLLGVEGRIDHVKILID